MKILFLSGLYEPYHRGGAESVVAKAVSGFVARGHEVVVITGGKYLQDLAVEKFGVTSKARVYRLTPSNIFWVGDLLTKPTLLRLFWHLFDVFNFTVYFKVKKILKQEKPDLILSHSLKGLGYLVPLAVANYCKLNPAAKYIHTIHDIQLLNPRSQLLWEQEHDWYNTNFLTRIYAAINRQLFSRCRIVVSPSRWLLDYYQGKLFFKNAKLAVIKNPIEIKHAEIISKKKEANEVHFLFLGQVVESKGIRLLTQIFTKLWQDEKLDKKIFWHIVGDGELLPEIQDLARVQPNLILHGFCPQERLQQEIWPKIDWLLLPSLLYENSPTVIFEGFSVGVPVIASNFGGVPEVVRDNENGFLITPGKFEEWEAKIREVCNFPPEKYKELVVNGKDALVGVDAESYIDKILEL